MNPSTTALTLNMQLPNIATVAWAVQGDQLSRHLECTLVDGSTAWTPQAGYHAVVRAHKPDGTACVYDVDEDGNQAVTWTGNVATVTIVQQALTVAGTVLMQLEFYDSSDARLTAFAWAMNVQPSAVTDNEFLSADYYNILTLQIAAVIGASGHPPYIDSTTKNWMVWDENVGDYSDSGVSALGQPGPYFTPSVSASGNISWTNNGGLPNPTTRNITGPQGVSITTVTKASGTGAPGTTDTYDVNLSTGGVAGQFNVYNGSDGAGSPGTQLPLMDGVAAVGSAVAYAHEDHVHPSDTAKQDTLVSGTNIKTVNGQSLLGSGNLAAIPTGGAAGKALVKASASDYDVTWGDAGGALWFTAVAVSATTGDIATISDSAITADHVLGRIEWANPSAITTDVTWTTSAGSLVLNGTASSATTANILLVLKNN